MSAGPVRARVFAFNVGFGDCFLMRLEYASATPRHVLIDFGSTRPPPTPKGEKRGLEARVADEIKTLCGGRLDLLVVTHRHKDHISGFATKSGKGSGDVIAGLKPRLVLQPWTEDPDVPANGRESKHQMRLAGMSQVAASVERYALKRRSFEGGAAFRAQLAFLGEDNLANKSAVENILAMGKAAEKGARFLKYGDPVSLSGVLPGVKVRVLGPPSLNQSEEIKKERANVAGEYWLQRGATAKRVTADGKAKPLFPKHVAPLPNDADWVATQARQAEEEALYGIVRTLDTAMNNTSLILLFEVGTKRLLFPGDAQWENWSYALSQAGVVAELKKVDLYKVGHHGSRNATPISLWNGFAKRGPSSKSGRLTSVMSTLMDVHGHAEDGTEVPRESLTKALRKDTEFHTTEGAKKSYVECAIDF